MYTNLYNDKDVEKRYGKGEISVNMKEFLARVVHIPTAMKDNNGKSDHGWPLPAQFNTLRYINDLNYVKGPGL